MFSRLLLVTSLSGSLLAACSSLPKPESDIAFSSSGELETIVIAGTNDIHGALSPLQLKTRESEGAQPVPYEAGGAALLGSMMKILDKEFGNRFFWMDAGDEFQGTIESNSEKGASMVRFFNTAGLDVAAIGNHEFDFGAEPEFRKLLPEGALPAGAPSGPDDRLGALKLRQLEARFPYLSANIIDKNTGESPFAKTQPSMIFDVGRLKVGVIGLTTLDTRTTTLPENIRALGFTPLRDATIREAARLRKLGAQLIVINGHLAMKCSPGKAPTYHSFRKVSDPLGDCDRTDGAELLRSLPPGTVDAMISGHSHQVVHHWVEGVPVIQGGASGRYTNLIYLTYDLKAGKLVTDRTRIEGPIPICPKVFQNQGDCNGDRPAPKNGRGALTVPRFHGVAVAPDPEVETLLQPVFEKAEKIKSEVISYAAKPIEHDRTKESELGDLVADAIRETAHADVAVMNGGGVRAPFEAGPITYGTVFQSLPFDNSITTLNVSGKELKTILRITESGARGFFSISGVRVKLIPMNVTAPSNDLDEDGKIAPWEVNRLLGATLADGSPIDDEKMYTLATLDFLVLGGDDMEWVMSRIPAKRIKYSTTLVREAFIAHLRSLAARWATSHGSESSKFQLASADSPILDPANPRMIFENPKEKKKPGKKNRGKRRKPRR